MMWSLEGAGDGLGMTASQKRNVPAPQGRGLEGIGFSRLTMTVSTVRAEEVIGGIIGVQLTGTRAYELV
jgi:hypothetical protein